MFAFWTCLAHSGGGEVNWDYPAAMEGQNPLTPFSPAHPVTSHGQCRRVPDKPTVQAVRIYIGEELLLSRPLWDPVCVGQACNLVPKPHGAVDRGALRVLG